MEPLFWRGVRVGCVVVLPFWIGVGVLLWLWLS